MLVDVERVERRGWNEIIQTGAPYHQTVASVDPVDCELRTEAVNDWWTETGACFVFVDVAGMWRRYGEKAWRMRARSERVFFPRYLSYGSEHLLQIIRR